MAGVSCPQLATRCHTPAPIWSLQFIRAHGQHSRHSIHITLSHQHHRSYRHTTMDKIQSQLSLQLKWQKADFASHRQHHCFFVLTASKSSQDPKCGDYQGFRSTKKCWCDCGGLEWLDWTISVIWCRAGESLCLNSSRDV